MATDAPGKAINSELLVYRVDRIEENQKRIYYVLAFISLVLVANGTIDVGQLLGRLN